MHKLYICVHNPYFYIFRPKSHINLLQLYTEDDYTCSKMHFEVITKVTIYLYLYLFEHQRNETLNTTGMDTRRDLKVITRVKPVKVENVFGVYVTE